jgi:hypothetical protein
MKIENCARSQGAFKNRRKSRSRRGDEAELFFAPKSASLRRRLPFLNTGASLFEPPPSETPSTKPQAPEKSRNRNTKNQAPNTRQQAPNTREAPSSKFQTRSAGRGLELGTWDLFGVWSLVFGVWNLVLLWSLKFGIWSFLPGLSASQKLQCARRWLTRVAAFGRG